MYSDDRMIQQLVALMKEHGVRHVVIAPGSRHYSMTKSLENDPYFDLHSVVDERSAGFYALGIIQKTREPAAVVCTSGTASINFGSAVAEAFYQKLPLLALTADRLPELLGQMEDQMFPQEDIFEGFTRFRGSLKEVMSDFDEWYVNRTVNEGLLALTHRGMGPVHLNLPIRSHHGDTFATKKLKARVIRRTTTHQADSDRWKDAGERLRGKKIMVLWGQSATPDASLVQAFEQFLEAHDAVVFADNLSNLHVDARINSSYSFFRGSSRAERSKFSPDIVIQVFGNVAFNGEARAFLAGSGSFEHWRVSEDGEISDPFRRLTDVFEAGPEEFFSRLRNESSENSGKFRGAIEAIVAKIQEPEFRYGELGAIGCFTQKLPAGSALHIANSAPIRMTQLFEIDPSVTVLCNRGVNGIDGCMSSAVGYSTQNRDLTFLVIGDLTFFYDMNSLWNREVPDRLRVLLLNNGGGAVMHLPLPEETGPSLGRHVSAQHSASARGWVESLGMTYIQVDSEEALTPALDILTSTEVEGPVIVEVFTDRLNDVKQFKDYMQSVNRELPRRSERIPKPLRFLIPFLKKMRNLLGMLRR